MNFFQAQNFLIVIIIAAMLDFVVGAIIGPVSDLERARGFKGLSGEIFIKFSLFLAIDFIFF